MEWVIRALGITVFFLVLTYSCGGRGCKHDRPKQK